MHTLTIEALQLTLAALLISSKESPGAVRRCRARRMRAVSTVRNMRENVIAPRFDSDAQAQAVAGLVRSCAACGRCEGVEGVNGDG